MSIVVDDIDLGVGRSIPDNFLWSVVATKGLRVDEHGTGNGSVEPREIEHRLRLAGSEEEPLAIYPSFYPSMVVIGVRPARGIDLASGDTDCTQSCDQECGLFATAPIGRAYGSQRRGGAGITWRIDDVLVAPAVDLEYRIMQGESLDAILQSIKEYHA